MHPIQRRKCSKVIRDSYHRKYRQGRVIAQELIRGHRFINFGAFQCGTGGSVTWRRVGYRLSQTPHHISDTLQQSVANCPFSASALPQNRILDISADSGTGRPSTPESKKEVRDNSRHTLRARCRQRLQPAKLRRARLLIEFSSPLH